MPTLDFVAARSSATRLSATRLSPTRSGHTNLGAHERRPVSVDPVAVVQLNDQLWRITRPEGDVLGYIEAFTATGNLFDRELADRLRREVLAKGDSRDPMESFRAFRGREPDEAALLRSRCLA